ncbi:hypothetical protein [Methylocystis parvus]|uniref:Uncharacterized protein n=1 Tax=Methylocystis parvus TaxID=134 RepID=A0A6B8MCW4_9HYPH|nr:hypothetical protein [Methylocystis parvus]QGM99153.1 hypothetical protein F7D14_17785 [Methylocystis parvus]WBK00473.1 hypothetical protein MMG94_01745 [Methylocystis parvus OBBP]
MKRIVFVGTLLLAGAGAALAKGGMQTWILVCSKSLAQGECNLTTAARWYHLPSAQPSATSPAVKAAKAQISGSLDSGSYLSVEQFPAGVSMGPRGDVFRACNATGATPADAQTAEWAQRGECLR